MIKTFQDIVMKTVEIGTEYLVNSTRAPGIQRKGLPMLFQIKPHLQVQASAVRAPSASSTRQDSSRPGVKKTVMLVQNLNTLTRLPISRHLY